MIVAAKLNRSAPSRSAPADPNSPTAAAASAAALEILKTEISFIPNTIFKKWDLEGLPSRLEPVTKLAAEEGSAPTVNSRMPAHLDRLCSAALLSPEEERLLFCRMNYLKYRANGLRATIRPRRPNRKALAETQQMLANAEEIRNRIVHANVRLVISIVKQFADEKNSFDELLSEGISCMIKAVDKFDFDRGFRFSTYATRAIRREVLRLVQRHHRDRSRYVSGSQEVLGQQISGSDQPEGSDMTWHQVDQTVTSLLGHLDDREKFIVQARYGFDDLGEKPTFQRLGELLGISKERVRQLEQRALAKLRQMAEQMHLEMAF